MPGRARLSLLLLPLLLQIVSLPLVGRIARAQWDPPQRVTFNAVEDRTTSGSLAQYGFYAAYAIWLERSGPGNRLMWAQSQYPDGFGTPQAVDPGQDNDFQPHAAADYGPDLHAVWQRGSSDAAEIVYGYRPYNGSWTIEPITSNATADLSPDICNFDFGKGRAHVVWVGFDPESGTGKIFHAVRGETGWQTERLADSQLGGFWTGASPRIDVDDAAVVHIVYRGGDYGDYHAHYARKDAEGWTIRILTSNNLNDFVVDVTSSQVWSRVLVAMSGNDGWGFPTSMYLRESYDGGLTFQPPTRVSSPFFATLGNLADGPYGAQVVGEEVSGNILTGDLIYSNERDGWLAEKLPPVNQASQYPSASQSRCVEARPDPCGVSVLYTNTGGHGADSAEVYFLTVPLGGGVESGPAPPARGAELRIDAAPNPFESSTWITVEMSAAMGDRFASLAIYDVSGRLVRRLAAGDAFGRAGRELHLWDGTATDGRPVTAGTYFVRVDAGDRSAARRLVLTR